MFKFSENETIETLDSVPENLRGAYVEGDNGFTIADALKGIVGAFDGANNANQKIRLDLKNAQKGKVDLSALSDYGTTPEEIAAAIGEKVTELSDVIDSKKNLVNPEKIRQQMTTSFESTKSEYQQKIDAYKGQLYDITVQKEAVSAIAAEKGDAKLLMPFITNQVKMVEEDNKLQARIVDQAGEVVYGQMGNPMTIREKIAEMKLDPDFGKLFESQQIQGSGKQGGGGNNSRQHQQQGVAVHDRPAVSNIAAGLAKMRRR